MEINEMNLNDIEIRMGEIRQLIDTDGADLDALNTEVDSLNERKKHLEQAEELRKAVSGGAGSVVRTFKPEEKRYDASSPEYRMAFLKTLRGEELTKEEREAAATAYTHNTTNTAAVLPTNMINRIWSLIEEEHPILGDVTTYRTGTTIEIVKHTAIAAGDAAVTTEGSAPTNDENNTFAKVTLSGKDFAKDIEVTYALRAGALDAFESYLINEIADRLGAAIAADIVSQIGTDMTAGNKVTSTAAKKTSYTELAGVFALLKRAKNLKIYATRKTIYTYLVGLVDSTGRPVFQVNAQEGAEGVLIGAQVKIEDAVADNKFLIGDPTKYVNNMIQDIMVEQDKDIKKHVYIYSGYARCQGALVDPDTFAELTVKQS